jgi:hypothetical protein
MNFFPYLSFKLSATGYIKIVWKTLWLICLPKVYYMIVKIVHNVISFRRMVSSGMLRRVALVITDVSEEPGASFIRVTKIGELGTTQAYIGC